MRAVVLVCRLLRFLKCAVILAIDEMSELI